MEDEEEYEYDEGCEFVHPSRRFMRTDLVVLGLDLVGGVLNSVVNTLATARNLAAAHANYKVEQHAFHEEAALEIEQMTSGDGDG